MTAVTKTAPATTICASSNKASFPPRDRLIAAYLLADQKPQAYLLASEGRPQVVTEQQQKEDAREKLTNDRAWQHPFPPSKPTSDSYPNLLQASGQLPAVHKITTPNSCEYLLNQGQPGNKMRDAMQEWLATQHQPDLSHDHEGRWVNTKDVQVIDVYLPSYRVGHLIRCQQRERTVPPGLPA
eukprot:5282255-Amphidinium_carterae.3